MPTSIDKKFQLKQLIPPNLLPTRGKSFQMSGNEEWLIYPHGKSVYLYNLKDHSLTKEYREHAYNVGVAKLSPSGRFVASGDNCGILRIWSVERDLKTELETKVLGGIINDLTWSEDEKLVAVCGEGRDQFANIIKVDGGGAFGELVGPSKNCTSIALKNGYCLLGSDDKTLTILKANPTYKFVKTLKDHDGFVQVVRFNESGSMFCSAGSDGKVIVYSVNEDAIEKMFEFKAHSSGILGMEWIDEDLLITGSTDKSLKSWKIVNEKKKSFELLSESQVDSTWTHGKQICGIKVDDDSSSTRSSFITNLRLDGSIEMINVKDFKQKESQVSLFDSLGHSKGIIDAIGRKDSFSTVSYDGEIKSWIKHGNGFKRSSCSSSTYGSSTSSTCDSSTSSNSTRNTCDNSTFNVQKLKSETETISENKVISTFGTGKVDEFESKIVGIEFGGKVLVLENGKMIQEGVDSVDTASNGNHVVALTTSNDSMLVTLTSENAINFHSKDLKWMNSKQLEVNVNITAMALNADGSKLALADDQRRIKVFSLSASSSINMIKEQSQWCAHSSRIDTLLWISKDLISSAGIDGNIMFWSLDLDRYGPCQIIKSAHSGPISKLVKCGEGEDLFVVSSGSDSCIKVWGIC